MVQLSLLSQSDPGDEPESDFLTVAEAAKRLRCPPRTIREAIERGALRASRPTGSWRIRGADLDAWLVRDDA